MLRISLDAVRACGKSYAAANDLDPSSEFDHRETLEHASADRCKHASSPGLVRERLIIDPACVLRACRRGKARLTSRTNDQDQRPGALSNKIAVMQTAVAM